MIALTRMRLAAFTRTGRILAPSISALVVIGVLYGGGQAQAGEAYGVSSVILFGVLAWQTKLLLDVEPDVQRRLARVAVGGARGEVPAGLAAALVAGLPIVVVALVGPWAIGGVTGPKTAADPPIVVGVVLGVWAHLLVLIPAVALGALASRVVAGNGGRGLAILLCGYLGSIVVGVAGSPVPWLGPPLMAGARNAARGGDLATTLVVTAWSLAWSTAALTGYSLLRRSRA